MRRTKFSVACTTSSATPGTSRASDARTHEVTASAVRSRPRPRQRSSRRLSTCKASRSTSSCGCPTGGSTRTPRIADRRVEVPSWAWPYASRCRRAPAQSGSRSASRDFRHGCRTTSSSSSLPRARACFRGCRIRSGSQRSSCSGPARWAVWRRSSPRRHPTASPPPSTTGSTRTTPSTRRVAAVRSATAGSRCSSGSP